MHDAHTLMCCTHTGIVGSLCEEAPLLLAWWLAWLACTSRRPAGAGLCGFQLAPHVGVDPFRYRQLAL